MTTGKPSYEEIESRLQWMEEALDHRAQLTVAHQFSSAVMHEINNPLEAMVNLIYLLQHDEALPPRAQERIAQLEEQMSLLTAVARQSLSYGRDQRQPKAVDTAQVAESALKLHHAKITNNRVDVHRRYGESAMCHGISGELLQLISNLILNALDAMAEAGVGTLHVRVRRGSGGIHMTVADNGVGIPQEMEGRLFTANASSKAHGSGLGLWLSDRILSRHNGAIRMRTSRRPGKSGTVFRVTLPHAHAA